MLKVFRYRIYPTKAQKSTMNNTLEQHQAPARQEGMFYCPDIFGSDFNLILITVGALLKKVSTIQNS